MKSLRKIRLTFFEDVFGMGGIETFITSVIGGLDQSKYELSLVVVNKNTDVYDDFLWQHHVDVVVLSEEKSSNPIQRFYKGLSKFGRYLGTHQIDILHFNLSDSIDLLYVDLAKFYGVKARIAHSHNSSVNAMWKYISHKILKCFVQNSPNYFFACSRDAAKWLFPKDVYQKKHYINLHNAIDLNKYSFNSQLRRHIRNDNQWEQSFVIGNVGRFNIQKNHKFLLDIFRVILQYEDCARLVLVGDGELRKQVEDYAQKIGVRKQVTFYGESQEVPGLLQGFDIMVMPSLYEGLPFVAVEAQAAALPLLISDTVTSEIGLTGYCRFLSLQKSPEEWARTIIEHAKIERNGNVTKQLTMEGYNLESMVRSIDKVYDEIFEKQYE